jgi:DtxR family Mn-dependent transcriptional regulator
VHAEAERLEHALSEEVEEAIARKLGYPTVDPHGDPIPSRDGALTDQAADGLLSDLLPGQLATVSRVHLQDSARLRYLGELGLYPGAQVRMLERSPFEGPLLVEVAGHSHMLAFAMANEISVTLVR